MIALRPAASVAALSTALATLPASAEITPAEVWANWQAVLTMSEQEMMVDSVDVSDDRVVVHGLALATSADGLNFRFDFGTLELVAAPGGTVEVVMEDVYTVTMTDDFEEARLVFEIVQAGTELIASGTPGMVRYDFVSPEVTVRATEFVIPDMRGDDDASLVFEARAVNTAGHYLFASDYSVLTSSGTMDSFTMDLDLTAPGDLGYMRGDLEFGASTSSVDIRNAHMLEEDPMMAMMSGLSMAVDMDIASSRMSFDFLDGSERVQFDYDSLGNALAFLFNRDGFMFDVRGGATTFTGMVPDFPFPVEMGMEEVAMRFDLPMTLEDAPPREMTALTRMVGLTVSEDIFGMFDPARVLPRTPATFIVDITGVGILNVMEAMMGGDMPITLDSMSLNELRVAFGGAELTGSGALTFDMDDLDTFDGIPRPEGIVSLALSGGNAFLDALGQLGLLGQEELMGARMGIGMFGRPVGPDQTESVIEFTPDGGLSVNGMRLQ